MLPLLVVVGLLLQFLVLQFLFLYLLFRVVCLSYYFVVVLFYYYLLFLLLSIVSSLPLCLFLGCFRFESGVYQKQPLYLTSKVEVNSAHSTLPKAHWVRLHLVCCCCMLYKKGQNGLTYFEKRESVMDLDFNYNFRAALDNLQFFHDFVSSSRVFPLER